MAVTKLKADEGTVTAKLVLLKQKSKTIWSNIKPIVPGFLLATAIYLLYSLGYSVAEKHYAVEFAHTIKQHVELGKMKYGGKMYIIQEDIFPKK
jgi:hypothetical protein